MLAFTCSTIAHLKESYDSRYRSSNALGVDTTEDEEDNTTMNELIPGAMNPYSPSGQIDLNIELFRLQSKHACLWKFVIVLYELALPAGISLSILFWVFVFPNVSDWGTGLSTLSKLRIICEHSLPPLLMIIDFCMSAMLFHPLHSLFLALYMLLYYLTNFLLKELND